MSDEDLISAKIQAYVDTVCLGAANEALKFLEINSVIMKPEDKARAHEELTKLLQGFFK